MDKRILLIGGLTLAVCAFAGFEDPPKRPGLSPFFSCERSPHAYEGDFDCRTSCYVLQKDAGIYPNLIREVDADPKRAIEKIIERSKKECPRIGW